MLISRQWRYSLFDLIAVSFLYYIHLYWIYFDVRGRVLLQLSYYEERHNKINECNSPAIKLCSKCSFITIYISFVHFFVLQKNRKEDDSFQCSTFLPAQKNSLILSAILCFCTQKIKKKRMYNECNITLHISSISNNSVNAEFSAGKLWVEWNVAFSKWICFVFVNGICMGICWQ